MPWEAEPGPAPPSARSPKLNTLAVIGHSGRNGRVRVQGFGASEAPKKGRTAPQA